MLSKKVVDKLSSSSMIRAMFEQGNELRAKFGAENVFDFSIGNPDPEPPKACTELMAKLATQPKVHAYMPNAGYPKVRQQIADSLKREAGIEIEGKNIVMTVGAGGALNVVFKSLLNEGEEVIALAPFFVEYVAYADNHLAKLVPVPTIKDTFQPDIDAIEKAITDKTKIILINNPNNPTGVVYPEAVLEDLAKMLERKEKETGKTIFVLSDEPYRKIAYDGVNIPSVLKIFKNSILVDSFSKSLSLPGERIGYIAANPAIECIDTLIDALIYCNRVLGFVNAPALMQLVAGECIDEKVDVNIYEERRNELYKIITEAGFECIKPEGAFYLFPKSPIEDDKAFAAAAIKHNLIVVPGSGFFGKGYFRLAYCVSMNTIRNSKPAFEALAKEFGLK